MKINRAYKTELDPNNVQKTLLRKHTGVARWTYNYAVDRDIEYYNENHKTISWFDISKEITALKHTPEEKGGKPWLGEVSKCVPQCTLQDFNQARKNAFQRCKNGAKEKGFPKHKKKYHGNGSFRVTQTIITEEKRIKLPIIGWIKLKRYGYLPIFGQKNIKIFSATISEENYHWFVSLNVEETIPDPIQPTGEPLGIDVGVKTLAVLSDGTVFENPKAAKKNEKHTKFLQKELSRKKKGSKNREEAKKRLAKHCKHVANIRKDSTNKATSEVIAKRPKQISIETLSVQNMMKNHKLAGVIADASMSEFHRQIEYKAKWAGIPVVKADRFFPSSKMCSHCGTINESLTLEDRIFKCECGFVIDRDLNAAINLRDMAGGLTATDYCLGSSG
jgi:putative transposase